MNRICQLLGIKYPIIGGGMVWWSNAELCAAIADTGCLGLLAGGSHTPDELVTAIDQVRERTDGVFGLNIPLIYDHAEELIRVALDKGVKIFFTSAGSPKKFTGALKEQGCVVVHVIPSAKLAMKCEQAGVDAVVAEGAEGGGHLAFDEVSSMVLWPAVADAVSIPVIAAGGIADARAMAAAFALGAEAVQIGTRFIACAESTGGEGYLQAVLDSAETGTAVTGRAFGPIRGIKNELTAKIIEMERAGKSNEEILAFIGSGRSRSATLDDDVDWGSMQCGQVAGLVKDRPPAAEIVRRFVEDYKKVIERVGAMDPASG